jgi:hypothetical protein
VSKLYRLIALLNTLNEILKNFIAEKLSYTIKTFNLFLKFYLDGRKLRVITDTVYLFIKKI